MPLYDCMYVIPKEEYHNLKNRGVGAQYNDSIGGDVNGGQVNHIELGEGGRVVIKPTDVVAATRDVHSKNKITIPEEAFHNWPKHPPYEKNDVIESKKIENNDEKTDHDTEVKSDVNNDEEKNNEKSENETEIKTFLIDEEKNNEELTDGEIDGDKKEQRLKETSKDKTIKKKTIGPSQPPVITGDNSAVIPSNFSDRLMHSPAVSSKHSPAVSLKNVEVVESEKMKEPEVGNQPMEINSPILRPPLNRVISPSEQSFRQEQALPDDDDDDMLDISSKDLNKNQNDMMNELTNSRLKKILQGEDGKPNLFRVTNKKKNPNRLSTKMKTQSGEKIGANEIRVRKIGSENHVDTTSNKTKSSKSIKVKAPKIVPRIEDNFSMQKKQKKKYINNNITKKIKKSSAKNLKTQMKSEMVRKNETLQNIVRDRLARLNGERLRNQQRDSTDIEETLTHLNGKKQRKRRQDSIETEESLVPRKVNVIRKK